MAEEEKAAGENATTLKILDDAIHSAEQTRASVKWIAGALGAVPSLGLVGAFIRGPGDKGFDPELLQRGLIFAVVGAVIALGIFAWIQSSANVKDVDLADVRLSRIPGAEAIDGVEGETGTSLVSRVNLLRGAVAQSEGRVRRATVAAKMAEVEASEFETLAAEAEAADKNSAAAKAARSKANAAKAHKVETAAELAGRKAVLDGTTLQYQRATALRDKAFLLRSADVISGRFVRSILPLTGAIALVVVGVYNLAVAPKIGTASSDASAGGTSPPGVLVRLTTNAESQTLLRCGAAAVDAYRTAASTEEATLITVRTGDCEPKNLKFPIVGFNGPMGSFEVIPATTAAPTTP